MTILSQVFFRNDRRQVALIEDDEDISLLRVLQDGPVFLGKGPRAVDDDEDDIGLIHVGLGLGDADFFDCIIGLPDTRRIDEADRDALEGNPFFQDVPRRPRHVGDDGPVFLEQAVQQARLAGVRRAGNGGHDAVANDAAIVGSFQHLIEGRQLLHRGP